MSDYYDAIQRNSENARPEAPDTLADRKLSRFELLITRIGGVGDVVEHSTVLCNTAADILGGAVGEAVMANAEGPCQTVADNMIERLEVAMSVLERQADRNYKAALRFKDQGLV